MENIDLNDLKFITNLTKLFNISKDEKITITKTKLENHIDTIYLERAENTDDLILMCNYDLNLNKQSLWGCYQDQFLSKQVNYFINIMNKTMLLLVKDWGDNVRDIILLIPKNKFSTDIVQTIIDGVEAIAVTNIADIQILTNTEEAEGKQLIKKNKN